MTGNTEEEGVEECIPCQVAVFGGHILMMCKNEAQDEKLCGDLTEKFNNGEITARGLYDAVRPKVNAEMQEQLDSLMEVGKDMGIPLDAKLPTEESEGS